MVDVMTRTEQKVEHFATASSHNSTGEVYSYTVVSEVPAGYEEQAPYILALVKLDNGALVTAQLTDVDGAITIGDRVEMVTRKITTDGANGMIVYGYKFRKAV